VIHQLCLLQANSLLEINFLKWLFVYIYSVLMPVARHGLDLKVPWSNALIACFSLTDHFDIDLQLLLVVKRRKVCQFHPSSVN